MFGIKRFYELFFPGFFTFGPSLWDAGSVISGASAISGFLGSDSASDASKAIGKANALTQQQIKEQTAQNNAAFSPYKSTGSSANNLLAAYLGLSSPEAEAALGIDRNNYIKGYTLSDVDPNNFDAAGYLAANPDVAASAKYGNDPYGHYQRWGKNENRKVRTTEYDTNAINAAMAQNPLYGSLLKNFSQDDLNKDVVYNTGLEFGLNQGNQAISRLASANGGIDSGSTLKALTRYANDYGTTKASDAYGRFMNDKSNTYGMLSGQQNVGLGATTNNQSMNNSLLTTGINSNMSTAQQQGQLGMAGANAWNNAIQGGIGNYLYNQRTNTPVLSYGSTYPGGYSSSTPFWK